MTRLGEEEEEGYVEAGVTEQGHRETKHEWRGMSHPRDFPVDWKEETCRDRKSN